MTEKLKVLLVLNEAPLPFSGAASRWYYILIQGLLHKKINFTVIGACKKAEERDELQKLYPNSFFYLHERNKKSFLQKLKTLFKPFSYTAPKEMRKKIRELNLKEFDVIHVEQTFAAWAFDRIPKNAFVSVHYLATLDQANVKAYQWKDWLISWLMKRTERRLLKKFKFVKSCSAPIENQIKEWFPNKYYVNFPFGIDYSKYNLTVNEERQHTKNILLVASMNWLPGKSAALNLLNEVWPLVKDLNPDAKLNIVGFDARSVLSDYLELKDVAIYENVPEVLPYFSTANVLVYIPNAGSGVKIKIQESMLLGIPVITNQFGIEGLKLKHNEEVMVATNFYDAAKLTHALLNDFELQKKLSHNARQFIIDECNEEKIVSEIIELYHEIRNYNA